MTSLINRRTKKLRSQWEITSQGVFDHRFYGFCETRVSKNAYKGATRQLLRELRQVLRGQDEGRRNLS